MHACRAALQRGPYSSDMSVTWIWPGLLSIPTGGLNFSWKSPLWTALRWDHLFLRRMSRIMTFICYHPNRLFHCQKTDTSCSWWTRISFPFFQFLVPSSFFVISQWWWDGSLSRLYWLFAFPWSIEIDAIYYTVGSSSRRQPNEPPSLFRAYFVLVDGTQRSY